MQHKAFTCQNNIVFLTHLPQIPSTCFLPISVSLPGVNFINILRACFLYESELSSFSLVTFWRQSIIKKSALYMLMKFTPGTPTFFSLYFTPICLIILLVLVKLDEKDDIHLFWDKKVGILQLPCPFPCTHLPTLGQALVCKHSGVNFINVLRMHFSFESAFL